ncbi:MAG: response regulator, partial [Anaerolineales bacterium]|nr:response regulator [Anaerolineales bacterium]
MEEVQKILIVDDKRENLFALEQILNQTGAEVVKATSGNQALIESLNYEFALAILDVQMPEMDGYELAEYLRSTEKTRNLPLVFLSAVYSDEYHVFKGYEAGAVDFIIKPVNPTILLGKTRVFLQLDRQKRALLQQLELQKAKNYLESILMAVSDTILVMTLDGLIQTVNRAALEMLDYSIDKIIGMEIQKFLHEPGFMKWLDTLRKKPSKQVKHLYQRIETEIASASGSTIPVLISGSALINHQGDIQGAVLAAVDITDRKMAERAIINYSEQLEARVQERT